MLLPEENPAAAVREEIEQLLIHSQDLHNRYREISKVDEATSQEREWVLTELRNTLRSVDWDLEDFEETLKNVQKVQSRFRAKPSELIEGQKFITDSKNLVQDIRDNMSGADSRFAVPPSSAVSSSALHKSPSSNQQYKYSRLLDNDFGEFGGGAATSAGDQFTRDTFAQQQLIMQSQDEGLERMGGSVHVLKTMSSQIGNELEEQAVMLDDMNREMDRTESKLDNVMRKLAKVTHMSDDKRQCTVILVLSAILIFLVILFIML